MTRPGASRDGKPADVRWLVGLAVFGAAFILVLELFVPPVIGIANNGDFEKVMSYVRVQYLTDAPGEKYWNYVVTEFGVAPVPLRHSGYHTSEIFLAAAARPLAAAVGPPGRFDIRALGAIHCLLLLAGLGLLVAASRAVSLASGVLVAVLGVFVFTDVAYAAPFNSFYSQTASLLFLLLTAGVAGLGIARGGLSRALLPLYFFFAGLFVVSKPQESLHGLVLAGLGVGLALAVPGATERRGRRRMAAAAVALVAGSYAYYRTTPRLDIHDVGLYHSTFMDLLPNSPDPGRDLDELGLDRSLLRYAGRNAYQPDSPIRDPDFQRQFFDRMGFGKLMLFYGRHPGRFFDRVRRAAPDASRMRPLFGNFEKKYGFPPATRTQHFDWWSTPKENTAPYALPLYAAFFAATLAASAAGFRRAGPRERLFRISLAALVVMALLEFFVCAFADFLGDLPRHLYSFHAMADLILIADLAWIAERISARSRAAGRRGGAAGEIAPSHPSSEPGMTEPGPGDPRAGEPGAEPPARPAALRALIALTILSAALILLFELFRPPVIGLANNADFANVMSFSGIQYGTEKPEEKYRDYIVTDFALVPPWAYPGAYRTSELLLADAARLIAPAVCPPGRFDIRVLGAVHVLLLLLGLALLVAAAGTSSWPARVTVALLCVFVFTDIAYGAPFNSFYGQTASLLFLLLTAGVAGIGISLSRARGSLSGSLLILYFLAAALFVVSKAQEAVQGPIFAVLGVLLAARATAGRTTRVRPRRLALGLAAGLLVLSFAYFRAIPRGPIHNVGLFHSVFKDLLPTSPDPARDLDDLGLDRSLLRYSGMHAYMPGAPLGDPVLQKQFFDRLGFGRLGLFYLRHPARFFDRVGRAAPAASRMRPALGNYEKKAGFPPRTVTTEFAWWSALKWKTRSYALPLFSVFFAATLAACAVGFRRAGPRERLFRIALSALVVLALSEFLVCAFADFLADLSRHLYSFHAMVDLILIADLAWIADRLSARFARRRLERAAA